MNTNESLLIETLQPSIANLQESKQDDKHWYLEGIFMQAEKQNGNGRIYPRDVLTEAVEKMADKMSKGYNVLGELEHPEALTVNLNNVSHVIESLRWDNDNVIGKAKILDTPKGNIVKALMKEGIKLGVSSRGSGATKYKDDITLVESFNLITVDIVATPSAPEAFPNSLQESLDVIYNDPKIVSLSEAVVEDTAAQKYFEKEIRNFLDSVINKTK
jgi:hypothetical protein